MTEPLKPEHCAATMKMLEQADADRRSGFVAGQYRAYYSADRDAWGVARFTDDGLKIGGALGPFTRREASKKASELNARSVALRTHAGE